MSLNSQERYFNGQEVLVDDLAFDQNARIGQAFARVGDLWTNGVVRDPNGLSNMVVSVDGTTATLFNVGQGTAYANGFRIDISDNSAYDASGPSFTTNGISTPRSSGSKGIPLANYTLGQPNYVWAEYLTQVSTGRTAISLADGTLHYPQELDGYRIVVDTTNPPGNNNGLTNAVYLATVFGQGVGQPLSSGPAGLTDVQKTFMTAKPSITSIVSNGTVRGSSANSGGVQREILQGTVSTPDFRAEAVKSSAIEQTSNLYVNSVGGNFGVGTTSPAYKADLVGGTRALLNIPGTALTVQAGGVGDTSQGGQVVFVNSSPGVPTPNKFIRVNVNGTFAIVNSNYTLEIFSVDDTGNAGAIGNVNANGKLLELGTPLIPTGTRMLFYQASVPAGWSAVAVNDFFLRVVSNATTGGAQNSFTSPTIGFNLQHSHTVASHSHGVTTDGSHAHSISTDGNHAHGISTDGAHTHTGVSHAHGIADDGAHTHTISSDGAHQHMIPYFAVTNNLFVYFSNDVFGRVNNGPASNKQWKQNADGNLPNDTEYALTSSDGSHTHSGATGSSGNHNHGAQTSFTSVPTDSQGAHNHTGATDQAGNHNHTGSTGTTGNHNHGGQTGNSSPGTDSQLSTVNKFSYTDVIVGQK